MNCADYPQKTEIKTKKITGDRIYIRYLRIVKSLPYHLATASYLRYMKVISFLLLPIKSNHCTARIFTLSNLCEHYFKEII